MNQANLSTFSVYDQINDLWRSSTVVLHRKAMITMSYDIEDSTLDEGRGNRFFAGLERMSFFLPLLDRYRALAAVAEHVYIFGVPDVTPPPIENLSYIDLEPTDKMAQEWFVVSYGLEFSSTLAMVEKTSPDMPHDARQFTGLWAFNTSLVRLVQQRLSDVLGLSPFMESTNADTLAEIARINASLKRFTGQVSIAKDILLQRELRQVMDTMLKPQLDDLSNQSA